MERKVKIRAHTYLAEVPDPRNPEQDKIVRKVATRDQLIDVTDAESERGDSLEAFYTDTETDPETGEVVEEVEIDFTEAGEDEIQEWIEEDSPTAKETIEAAEGDPDVARRILAAEEATGDARKSVVKGLGAIINRDQ